MKRMILCALAGWLALAPAAPAAKHTIELTLSAGKHDRAHEPVCVPLQVPEKWKGAGATLKDAGGKEMALFDLAAPGLGTQGIEAKKDHVRRDLHFILPELKAGKALTLQLVLDTAVAAPQRDWGFRLAFTREGGLGKLMFTSPKGDERKVLDYLCSPLDESTPATREATFKVFHRAYSPDGKVQLTKDAGGQFTHHRGLFYGFMKASYDKHTVDIWHCHSPKDKRRAKQEAHQTHAEGGVTSVEGPVLGRYGTLIDWNGVGKKTFAKEVRELTVYNVPGGNLIEFVSKLTPTGGDVTLDGDPQHAGFHFRASNEVAEKTKSQTIFIRPSGTGKPGTEVNWPKDKKHVNLPWLAMSFVVGGKRYTAAYLDHPNNPKEARFSERTYGRFGSYFVAKATKDKPLVVRYRVWLQDGQMTGEQVKAKATAFVTPVEVKMK